MTQSTGRRDTLRTALLVVGLFISQFASAQKPGFAEIFQRHGVAMLLIEPASGQIRDANPAATSFYGYDRDTLRGMPIDRINTLSPQQVADERALAALEGRNYFIFRHQLADGEIRTVEVRSHPFEFDGDRLLLSVIHDITPGRNLEHGLWHYQQRLEELVDMRTREATLRGRTVINLLAAGIVVLSALSAVLWLAIRRRRRAETALAERSRELESAIAFLHESESVAGLGHWTIEPTTGTLEWSAQTRRMFGVDDDASISFELFSSLIHPDDRDSVLEAWHAATATGSLYEVEHRIVVGDSVRWVRERADVSRSREGRVVGTVLDTTEHKNTELELSKNQQLLRSAIETIGEAFVIYDENDRLIWCNDKYREMYPSVAHMMRPGVRFEEIVREWVRQGAADVGDADPEDWISRRMALHRSGQIMIQRLENDRWARIIERTTPAGQIVGFRVDITELVKAREAAEAASVAKSRFLATMSHELRTPLNGIMAMAQSMLSQDTLTQRQCVEHASSIHSSGQILLTLLNDVLDLSKIEAGGLTLESGIVVPGETLAEVRSLFSGVARDRLIALSATWKASRALRYRGDPYRLRQMLMNLVGNALKFTEHGEVRIEGRPVLEAGDHSVLEFSVTDTGIGIPQDRIDQLFRPFSQLDDTTTRRFGGTGLGLSIVRSLARAMGGETGAESEPGKGARFWFRVRLEAIPTTDSDVGTGAMHTADPAQGPATRQPITPSDLHAVRHRITALLPLLDQSKFDAVHHFRDLERDVAGTALADELAALRPTLEAFRFAETSAALKRVLMKQTVGDET